MPLGRVPLGPVLADADGRVSVRADGRVWARPGEGRRDQPDKLEPQVASICLAAVLMSVLLAFWATRLSRLLKL